MAKTEMHSLEDYHLLKSNRVQRKEPIPGVRSHSEGEKIRLARVRRNNIGSNRVGKQRFTLTIDEPII